MPGGSSPLGLIGYVNAAFELHQQVRAGALQAPDVIYIASGTLGSSVGLALGCGLLGLETRICAVAVTDTRYTSTGKARRLFQQANSLLRNADASVPRLRFEHSGFRLRHDFFGDEYGLYTEAGIQAMQQVSSATGLKLEGCYTGKCAAALLHDLHQGNLHGKRVMLWNTYDAQGAAQPDTQLDYHELPAAFHRYYEHDVQPLDRCPQTHGECLDE